MLNSRTIGEICDATKGEVRTGPFGSQLHESDYSDRGIPVVMPKDIIEGKVSTENIARVDDSHTERLAQHKLKCGDIVYGRRGDIGRQAYIAEDQEGWLCGTGCLRITVGPGIVLPKFLHYYLRDPNVIKDIANQAIGATMPNLNTSILRSVVVKYPVISTQNKIAAILSAYDDLIENNTRRIKILEEMARSLYREWFVHFRFPGHEKVKLVDSPLGKVPEDWNVFRVEEVVSRKPIKKKYDSKTVLKIGSVPILDQGKSGIIGYHNNDPDVNASENSPIIIFANHTCYQRIILFPFSAIQNVLPFVSNPAYPRNLYWLHYATNNLVAFNDYKGHWPEFMSKKLLLPPAELCSIFGNCAEPIVHQCYKLDQINQNLRRTRDLLLPKLISGQLDVSKIPEPNP